MSFNRSGKELITKIIVGVIYRWFLPRADGMSWYGVIAMAEFGKRRAQGASTVRTGSRVPEARTAAEGAAIGDAAETPVREDGVFDSWIKRHPFISGFVFLAVLGSQLQKNTGGELVTRTNEGNCSATQRDAAQGMIRAYGYSCAPVNFCLQSSWDGSYRVTCNSNRYVYRLEDRGGNWTVMLK